MDPALARWLLKITLWIALYYWFYKPAQAKNRNGCLWWIAGGVGYALITVGMTYAGIEYYLNQPGARDEAGKVVPGALDNVGYFSIAGFVLAAGYFYLLHVLLKKLPLVEVQPNAAAPQEPPKP